MGSSRWLGWIKGQLVDSGSSGPIEELKPRQAVDTTGEELVEDRVIEAIARQRAHAELSLSRTVVLSERLPELGRRMACQEIAKHLQIEEEVWTRALKLAQRGQQNRPG